MGAINRMSLLLQLIVLWSANGVAKGLDVERTRQNNLDTDEIFHSPFKIHTCCDINLDLAETQCSGKNPKDRPQPSKLWTFPRHMMAENVSTAFQLEPKRVKCQSDTFNKIYISSTDRGEMSNKFLKNGYLKVEKEYYARDEYCINSCKHFGYMCIGKLEVLLCPQNCTGSRPCIKKCCSLDKIYSLGANTSVQKGCQALPKGDYFNPIFYDDYTTKSSHSILEPHYMEHYPSTFKLKCESKRTTFFVYPEASESFSQHMNTTFNGIVFRLREDGKIMLRHPKDGKCTFLDTSVDDICIDGVINYHPRNDLTYLNHEREIIMVLCTQPPSKNPQEKKIVGMLYGIVMLVSSIFLLLTIGTYLALWERQSVHGWTIVSHTVSLLFMYIFLGVAHIIGVNSGHNYLGTPSCTGIGILTHFFFLSTFCWLSLISIDLWLTFRAFTPRSSGRRSKGLGRYIKYSIGGWGIPFIFVLVGIILDKKFPEEHCHTLITPAYGKDSCFPQQKALGVYLYYPIAVLLFINLLFFAITTYKLYLYRQSTKMATKDDKQQQFYRLFFKLFFIMGVLWVFEVISWSLSGTGYQWYWIMFDMLNVLRALAVFIIFVCKRDIIFALEENYPCLKPILLPFAWFFKRRHSTHGDNSSMTRTSTLRQTISSDGKPESIPKIHTYKPESIGLMQR